jgi:hypothetical protein
MCLVMPVHTLCVFLWTAQTPLGAAHTHFGSCYTSLQVYHKAQKTLCLGIIDLLGEKFGSGQGQTRKKMNQAVEKKVLPGITTMCTYKP